MSRFFHRPINIYSMALVAVLCVVCGYPEVVLNRCYITWDSYVYLYPKFLYLVDSVKSGYFPLWNPFEMAGVPLLPWNGSLFNPINLIFVLFSLVFPPDYIFQLMLLMPVTIGGIGAYFLFKRLRYSEPVALFGCIAVSLSMFGPILGQYSIAYSVAFMPWVFYMVVEVVDSKGLVNPVKVCLFSLSLAVFFYTAYPVMVFLIGLAAVSFGLFRIFLIAGRDSLKLGVKVFRISLPILFLALAASSVAVFPMLENRSFVARQLEGDFVSPDPRLRVSLSKTDGVLGYDRTRSNYLALAKDNVLWHSTFTLILSFLLAAAIFRFFRDPYIPFFLFLSLVFVSYVKGRGGFIYELIFDHVPLFWNNRYPIFGLSLVKFTLLMVSMGQLDYICKLKGDSQESGITLEKGRILVMGCIGVLLALLAFYKPFYWGFSIAFMSLSLFFYLYLGSKISTRLFMGVLSLGLLMTHYVYQHSYYYSNNVEERILSRGRNVSPEYNSNLRTLVKSKDYIFYDHSWVFSKSPVNQGYYTADIPAYWYLKNLNFLSKIFYLSGKVRMQSPAVVRANHKTDNDFIDALVGQVADSSEAVSIVDRLPEDIVLDAGKISLGTISNIEMKPNSFSASVNSRSPALLVLTDKYYPGWEVYVDGGRRTLIRTNICFKGVYLEAGNHEVRFVFYSKSFYVGLSVSLLTLIGMGLFCFYARKKVLQEGAE